MIELPAAQPDFVDWSQPVNWSHPLNRGLAAWWLAAPRFAGGATWRDALGVRHGTLTNMDPKTDWQTTDRRGGWGQLDLVSASSQSIIVPSAVVTAYPLTFSAWIRPDTTTSGVILSTMREDTGAFWNGHYLDMSSGTLQAVSVVSNAFRVASSSTSLSTGVWQQVTGVFASATSRTAYINGVPGTTNTESSAPTSMANTVISGSKRSVHEFYFDGRVDNVRIWNRALTTAEVRLLHRLDQQYMPGMLNVLRFSQYRKVPVSNRGAALLMQMIGA